MADEATETAETAGDQPDPTAEVILEGFSLPEKDEAEQTEDAAPAAEADEATAPEPKAAGDIEKRLADVEKNYSRATAHLDDLKKALHQTRQENKRLKETKDGGEEVFTDAQLKAILEEHGSDWGVAMNVIKQMVKQESKKGDKQVLDDVETKQVRTNLEGFLSREWPEAMQDGSEARTNIEKAKEHFKIAEHPFADFLAASAYVMTNIKTITKSIEDRVRKEALGDKAEAARKQTVVSTKLSDKGSKAAAPRGLPVDVSSKAKQMGLNKRQTEIYAKLLKGGKKMAATVGA